MSELREPAILEARTLEAKGRWDEAFDVIQRAYQEKQTASIASEYGIALCYQARENEALNLLHSAKGGQRYPELVAILAAHYAARRWMAKKLKQPDLEAESAWRDIRKLTKVEGIALGDLPKPTLAATLIVKNEEKHIEECLRSIKPICDDIIVVDTGSTDNTIAIAERLGARVSTFAWCDDFAAARNHALSLATTTWCLWIDADERLEQGSYGAILSALVRPHFGGYTIEILNFVGRNGAVDELVHRPCRLFRNLPEVRFEGKIHEQITPSLARLHMPIAFLDARLIHYGYMQDEVEAKRKHERTVTLLLAALEEDPNDNFQQFNLANAHYTAGEFQEALPWYEKMADGIPEGALHGQFAFQGWALSLCQLHRYEEALQVCDRASLKGFQGPLVEYARAHALFHLGRAEEALECIEKAKQLKLKAAEVGDRGILTYKLDFLKGQILANLGESYAAAEAFRKVLRVAPQFYLARIGLALQLKAQGELKEAIETAAEAIHAEEECALLAVDIVLSCARECNQLLSAVSICAEASRIHPNSRELWERWISTAEAAEDWHSAVEACSHFAQHFDADVDVLIRAARALSHVGKYQLALQCLEDACQLDPTNPNVYWHVGDLFSKCELWADAALAYRKGLTIDSSNANAWFTLGNALYYLGKPDAAALAFETALAIQPGHEKAEHNLSIVRNELKQSAS